MVERWGQVTASNNTPLPSRHDVSEWVVASYNNMPSTIIRNSWTRTDYAWFDKQHDNDKNDNNIDDVNDEHEIWNNEENEECYWDEDGWNVDLYRVEDEDDSIGNNDNDDRDNGITTI